MLGTGVQLYAARNVALRVAALRWDDRALQKDEIPEDLRADKAMVLIYLLPKVFETLRMPMAALFNRLWQYGKSEQGELKHNSGLPGSPYYWTFTQSDFAQSQTVNAVLDSALEKNVNLLPQMGMPDGANDERWEKLRQVAKDAAKRHKGEDEWSEQTRDYRQAMISPEVLLETRQIDTGTYLVNGESPLSSDAYAAIGPCAVRIYLMATLRKKSGDDKIYVKPLRVAARVWDDYNFRDEGILDVVTGILTTGRASQFLGSWANAADGSLLVLVNADFARYRDKFRPRFNEYLDSKRSQQPRLACGDFHPISAYVEKDITSNVEFALFGI